MSRSSHESVFTQVNQVETDADGFVHVKDKLGLDEVLLNKSSNGYNPKQVKAGMCITFEYLRISGCSMLTNWTVEKK